MVPELVIQAKHEAPSQLALSLRQAHELLEPRFEPPLRYVVPSSEEYLNLNKAIVYGALCKTDRVKVYIKYLHAIVNDGYAFFVKLLVECVDQLYSKLVDSAKFQLLWVTSVVIDVAGVSYDSLLVSLLRQIVAGDFSDSNLWLTCELINLFTAKWDLILDEQPMVLASVLYTYLRLLADHYRLPNDNKSEGLKRREIGFCVRVLREQFSLCSAIGRDLIRLLKDLLHVPEFRAIWKDLISKPGAFKCGFSDFSGIYGAKTSSRYFLLRITPEMETQLRFLMTHVKLGNQKRHQAWFVRKYLFTPERETLIYDIIRFICCSHHPSNEIIQSDVLPRWAVVGWLLMCCRSNRAKETLLLALFYDWLFFNENVDNIMTIEPAMLLMSNSISTYIDITITLLESLVHLIVNYDVERKYITILGVSSAFRVLLQKGVVSSLDFLLNCEGLSPFSRDWLQKIFRNANSEVPAQLQPVQDPGDSPSMLNSELPSIMEIEKPLSGRSVRSYSSIPDCSKKQLQFPEDFVRGLGELIRKSREEGLRILQTRLFLYINVYIHERGGEFDPQNFARMLEKELMLYGYKLFVPLKSPQDTLEVDDEILSATAIIIRTFVFSQHPIIKDMLVYWSRSAPVGARLLSYASRLAFEAHIAGVEDEYGKKAAPLLESHMEAYMSFLSGNEDVMARNVSFVPKVGSTSISKLIKRAFGAYRCLLTSSKDASSEGIAVGKILSDDILSCSVWRRKRIHTFIRSIFTYLPDVSVGEENLVRFLVRQMNHADLTALQIDISLKRFCIFGDSVDKFLQLIRKSIQWPPIEQHKLWDMVRSELAASKFPLRRLLFDCFENDLDADASSIIVGGLLMLCSCAAPTTELVGAVLLLPDSKFPDFAAAVLANWIASNASMLLTSINDFFDDLKKTTVEFPVYWDNIPINQSAISHLSSYMEGQGVRCSSELKKLSTTLEAMKAGRGDPATTMDCG